MSMNRREAREAVFHLLFETEFRTEEAREDIYALSVDVRELGEDAYVRAAYFGVCEHLAEIDELINKHARGWKTTRISRVSRSLLRLCVYEMLYCDDIPSNVSLNEAIELCKTFDDENARPFVNGVLNSIKNEISGAQNG